MNSVLKLGQRINGCSFRRISTVVLTNKFQKCVPCHSQQNLSELPTKPLILKSCYFTQIRLFSETSSSQDTISQATYEHVCSETLESLNEYFEELAESAPEFKEADVTYGDGVLTVRLGGSFGTYVINRQSPNKQIWLSSPSSGPKRYDFVVLNAGSSSGNGTTGYWLYKQDKQTLHELIQNEIGALVKRPVDFLDLPFGSKSA